MAENQNQLLDRVLMGNQAAISFCEEFFGLTQIWDDLYDGDNYVEPETINEAFWVALISLPNNPFYQQHFGYLNTIIQSAIMDWLDSNKLVDGTHEHKCAAYVLRDSASNLVIHCAYLIGGYDWMREISIDVRRALYDEPLNKFMEEHSGELQQT